HVHALGFDGIRSGGLPGHRPIGDVVMSQTSAEHRSDAGVVAQTPSAAHRRTWMGYLTVPVILGLVCLGLFLYVQSRELDTIEQRSLNIGSIGTALQEHIVLTAVSTLVTLVIAVPLGVLLTRPLTRRIRPFIIGVLTILQAVPTIAILVLLAVAFLFLGLQAAFVGLVLYAIIPVLLNTMVGLGQVDEYVLEAGRGMGLSRMQVLRRTERPRAGWATSLSPDCRPTAFSSRSSVLHSPQCSLCSSTTSPESRRTSCGPRDCERYAGLDSGNHLTDSTN